MVGIFSFVKDINKRISKKFHFRTALHFAAIGGRLEVTKFLVEHGAKVKATTYDGYTPYDKAVSWEKNEVIKYFKEKTMFD